MGVAENKNKQTKSEQGYDTATQKNSHVGYSICFSAYRI